MLRSSPERVWVVGAQAAHRAPRRGADGDEESTRRTRWDVGQRRPDASTAARRSRGPANRDPPAKASARPKLRSRAVLMSFAGHAQPEYASTVTYSPAELQRGKSFRAPTNRIKSYETVELASNCAKSFIFVKFDDDAICQNESLYATFLDGQTERGHNLCGVLVVAFWHPANKVGPRRTIMTAYCHLATVRSAGDGCRPPANDHGGVEGL